MKGKTPQVAARDVKVEPYVQRFIDNTFDIINTGESHRIASAFCFGREDVIPDMFFSIIRDAEMKQGSKYEKLRYYLERHIEVDGDDHGPLAMKMIKILCGEDEQKWKEALETAEVSLQRRVELWDGIEQRLSKM